VNVLGCRFMHLEEQYFENTMLAHCLSSMNPNRY